MFAVPLLYLYPCLLRSFTLLLSYLLSFTWGTLSLSLFFFYILPVIFLLLLYFIFILVYLLFDLWYFCCPFALSLSMFYILSFTCDISAAPLLYLYHCLLFYILPGAFLLLYLYRCFIFYLGNSGSSNTCSSCSDWDGNDLTWNWKWELIRSVVGFSLQRKLAEQT